MMSWFGFSTDATQQRRRTPSSVTPREAQTAAARRAPTAGLADQCGRWWDGLVQARTQPARHSPAAQRSATGSRRQRAPVGRSRPAARDPCTFRSPAEGSWMACAPCHGWSQCRRSSGPCRLGLLLGRSRLRWTRQPQCPHPGSTHEVLAPRHPVWNAPWRAPLHEPGSSRTASTPPGMQPGWCEMGASQE